MSDSPDAQLQLKKRARRRLVGAVAFAGLAAVILPMVMDEEPKQQVQDIQIRIPGQEQAPFSPKLKPAAPDKKEEPSPVQPAPPAAPTVKAVESPASKAADKPVEKAPEKVAEKPTAKPAEKAAEKTPEKPQDKSPDKSANGNDAQRAAAILAGKAANESMAANGGQFVVLIGAFSNPANVKQLQTKIGELGIKVYTEPLDSPGGKKTRVRAGPFANRDAAEKALEKMKRIGVNGVVAARQ